MPCSKSFCSKYSRSWFFITVLDNTGKIEIGWKLVTREGSLFLKTGMVRPVLRTSGKTPISKTIVCQIGNIIYWTNFFFFGFSSSQMSIKWNLTLYLSAITKTKNIVDVRNSSNFNISFCMSFYVTVLTFKSYNTISSFLKCICMIKSEYTIVH